MFQKLKNRKNRKGFSLVELVVVILIIAILAVAVFAGGSAAIKKSQVSRTTSDLHNFSIAIESALNETPTVANMKLNQYKSVKDTSTPGGMKEIIDAVNNNLPADYQLSTTPEAAVATGNLQIKTDSSSSYVVLKSTKTDAWDNPYYVIFDYGERHCTGQSDFYITVVSAGSNAQTTVGGLIEADDIFLLVQYSDGDVSAVTYKVEDGNLNTTTVSGTSYTLKKNVTSGTGANANVVVKGAGGSILYAGGEDYNEYTDSKLPVNF